MEEKRRGRWGYKIQLKGEILCPPPPPRPHFMYYFWHHGKPVSYVRCSLMPRVPPVKRGHRSTCEEQMALTSPPHLLILTSPF